MILYLLVRVGFINSPSWWTILLAHNSLFVLLSYGLDAIRSPPHFLNQPSSSAMVFPAVQVRFDLADDLMLGANFVMAAMAHVQPENIRACFMQGADHFVAFRCRSKRRYNLYMS